MSKTVYLLKIIMNVRRKWRLFIILTFLFIMSFIQIYVSDLARQVIDENILDRRMVQVVMTFILITIMGIVITYVGQIMQNNLTIDIILHLRNSLVDKVSILHTSYFSTGHTGKLGNHMFNDIEEISNYLSNELLQFIGNFIMFVVSFIYLISINPLMTLITCISIPLTIIFANKIVNPLFKTMTGYREKMDEALSISKDSISGMDVIKAYNIQEHRSKKFNKVIDEAVRHFVNYEKYVAISGPIKYVIKSLPTFIYIIIAFIQMNNGNVTGGELVAFTYLLRMISKPLSTVPSFITEHITTLALIKRYQDILEYDEECGGTEKGELNKEEVFEFKNMSFSYNNEKEVLKDINFTIKKGKTTAFVGASGCGKTTMYKLMMGQYKPTSGELYFNGIKVENCDLQWLRNQISYVSQDSYLFPVSVAENIGYGRENYDIDDIEKVAKAAYAHDFILDMPEGYNTIISENGGNLSGGQKQRIAIARAMLKDAPIFMLDEMTSALDYESEKYVQQSIDSLDGDKTVIIIAHRLSTIINADEIVVFDNGKVVERGNHETLLKKSGVYCQLYDGQFVD